MSQVSSIKVQKAAATIADECLSMRVRYLNRALTSIYDEAFRPYGITASQVNMLVAIVRRGALSSSDLSVILNMDKSTVSRNLERMGKAGWIDIEKSASGRKVFLQASETGKALLLEIMPVWERAQKDSAALLGSRGADALLKASNRMRETMPG